MKTITKGLYLIFALLLILPLVSAEYSVPTYDFSLHTINASSENYQVKVHSTGQAQGYAQGSFQDAIIGPFGSRQAVQQTESGVYASITANETVTGGNTYSATIEIRNSTGSYVDADSLPTIKLYDPLRNVIVNNADTTKTATGTYSYSFTTAPSHTYGQWETRVSVTVAGNARTYTDYWTLVGTPLEATINSITDNTVPTITADVLATNEGNTNNEYSYSYCIVSDEANQCGGGDDEASGSGSKLINTSQSWNPQLTLSISAVGTYWFKVSFVYGGQTSGASKSFTAVAESQQPTGGGGGGDDSPEISQSIITGEAVARPSKIMDVIVKIFEDSLVVNPGGKVVAELILYNLGLDEIKDATLSYSVMDEAGDIIVKEVSETIAIHTKAQLVKKIQLPNNIKEGIYYLQVKVSYNSDSATARANFEVMSKSQINFVQFNSILIIIAIIILIVVLFCVRKFKHRNGKAKLIKKEAPEIKRKAAKLKSRLSPARDHKRHSTSELVHKEVYTDSGHYVGKVMDVILEKNKVDSLKIKFDKKKGSKAGIIIKYSYVKDIGQIVIVDKAVLKIIAKST